MSNWCLLAYCEIIPFQLLSQLTDPHEIWYGHYAISNHSDIVLAALTIFNLRS
jgi:hypothetical protein